MNIFLDYENEILTETVAKVVKNHPISIRQITNIIELSGKLSQYGINSEVLIRNKLKECEIRKNDHKI